MVYRKETVSLNPAWLVLEEQPCGWLKLSLEAREKLEQEIHDIYATDTDRDLSDATAAVS